MSDQRRLAASELSRRQYLAALGILQYEARELLPHARKPVIYDWASLTDDMQAETHSAAINPVAEPPLAHPQQQVSARPLTTSPAVTSRAESAKNTAVVSAEGESTETTANATARTPVNATVTAEELATLRIEPPAEFADGSVKPGSAQNQQQGRFSLFVSSAIAGRLLVLQPERAQNWLAASEQRLADDLYKAIALDVTASCAGQYFHWPILPTPGQPQGVAQPSQAFSGFIDSLVERGNIQLLVFSGAAAERVFTSTGGEAVFSWLVANRSIQVCVLPPMAQLLSDWRAKSLAWQRLKSCLYR